MIFIVETKFDKEYATQWISEITYLSDHGIKHTFVKKVNGIDTYKYTKNFALFKCLADFYENVYSA